MKRELPTIFILAGFLLITTQCATSPDPEPPLQTRILEVRVEPNPVAVGDTATFTCIIEDSLDERFEFGWNFGFHTAEDTTTKQNWVRWKAPDTTGEFNHTVNASNGAQDSLATGKSFTVTVTE